MNTPAPVADPTSSMPPHESQFAATGVPSPVPVAPVVIPQLPEEPVLTPLGDEAPVAHISAPEFDEMDDVADTPISGAPPQKSVPKSSKKKKSAAEVAVTMATAATTQADLLGENTGRWTAEEHRLFLQGLELHGKGWKKIASLIKSRTVVQIRTHAQKYFQKLAKAKQNGEEGEILMEGRGGTTAVPSVTASAALTNKRRKQTSGTKRKAIQSVVASAQRQGKKQATGAEGTVPGVAPALAPYILPPPHVLHPVEASSVEGQHLSSMGTAHGTVSGAALEDSLFRYLTPVPVAAAEPQLNEIARQAGANPITLPSDQPHVVLAVGETSPTGVADFTLFSTWSDFKDTPSWYAKGSDVDALLDVADNLDWLTDSGDLNETYEAAAAAAIALETSSPTDYSSSYHDVEPNKINPQAAAPPALAHYEHVTSMSMNTLPRIDSGAEVDVPPLPSLFDLASDAPDEPIRKLVLHNLISAHSVTNLDDHLQVFDTPIEEHDFVSTILDDHVEAALANS